MGHKCVVRGCNSEWYPGCDVKFHLFPINTQRRNLWLSIVPLKSEYYKGAKICSWHFKQTDYEYNGKRLKPTASPFFVESCSSTSRLIPMQCDETDDDTESLQVKDSAIPTPILTQNKNTLSSSRSEQSKPTICVSKRLNGYLEIPPLTRKTPQKYEIELPETPVPAPEDANPLFLENEPMDAIAQDSDSIETLSIKSENISIKSDGVGEGQLESDEDKDDTQAESCENVQKIDGKNYEQNDNNDDDDKYENYKSDDDGEDDKSVDGNETDITGSLSCSSSEAEHDEEMPIPIPTTTAASTTRVAPTTMHQTPIDHASPAYKQVKLLQRQKIKIETLSRKIKCLHSQIGRKNKKIEQLKTQLCLLKEYTKCSEIENILRGNFRKLCTAVNKNGVSVNYSDEVIKFALTLNCYSPKAYEFIRKYMSLPNTRMLEKYAATGAYIINLDD